VIRLLYSSSFINKLNKTDTIGPKIAKFTLNKVLSITVLFFILNTSLVNAGIASHSERPSRMVSQEIFCDLSQNSKVWIQNKCNGGFLMINTLNSTVIKNISVSRNHPEVEFIKESCIVASKTKELILTRLLSSNTQRYICVDKENNRLITIPKDQIHRNSMQCSFIEQPVTTNNLNDMSAFVKFRSLYHQNMYISGGKFHCYGNTPTLHAEYNNRKRPVRINKTTSNPRGHSTENICKFHFYTGNVEHVEENRQWFNADNLLSYLRNGNR